MDGLSTVASVASVAAVGVQLSKTIYDVVTTIKSGNEEIQEVADHVSVLSVVLEELQEVLNHEKLHFRPALEENARIIVSRCEGIFKDIEKHTKGTKDATTRKLKWYFKREKVRPLRASLESLKSTLSILLQVVQLGKTTQDWIGWSTTTSTDWEAWKDRQSLVVTIMENRVRVERLEYLEQIHQEELESAADHLPMMYDGTTPLLTDIQRSPASESNKTSFKSAAQIHAAPSLSEHGQRRSRSRQRSAERSFQRSHSHG